MEELHKIAFGVAKSMLIPKMELNGQSELFLEEFKSFMLMQKKDMISSQNNVKKKKLGKKAKKSKAARLYGDWLKD